MAIGTSAEPSAALARLLQLASPALPVGAYSYSQGLEAAVEAGLVHDAASAERWIGDVLELALARGEAPALAALMRAWRAGDADEARRIDETFLAMRESAELRAETLQMGYSLARLLAELGEGEVPLDAPSFPAAWGYAAVRWGVAPLAALEAYLWAWLENQAMAAIKAVPLGQTAAQRMLGALGARLARFAEEAEDLPQDRWTNFAPRLALHSARHETQYSRIFRS